MERQGNYFLSSSDEFGVRSTTILDDFDDFVPQIFFTTIVETCTVIFPTVFLQTVVWPHLPKAAKIRTPRSFLLAPEPSSAGLAAGERGAAATDATTTGGKLDTGRPHHGFRGFPSDSCESFRVAPLIPN